jgi:2',3'-cyclic-nucleotide 3'-phosphodiesterase
MTTQTTLKPSDPGLSLWLVPPPNSSIHQNLTKAITHTVPQALNSSNPVPLFEPHLTLTSRIPRQTITDDPQKWLDEIKLPPIPEAVVSFKEVAVGDAYFKKLFIRCKRDEALLRLARACRVHSSKGDGEEEYDPHVSLV